MDQPAETPISRAEFARRIGVDRAHVTRLAQDGRLVLDPAGDVLESASRARMAVTADDGPVGDAQRERWADYRTRDEIAPPAAPETAAQAYREARARKLDAEAAMAMMQRATMEGRLIDRPAVRRMLVEMGTVFRTALERMPDHLAAQLAAEPDPERVHALLVERIEQVLSDVVALGERRLDELGREGAA